MILKRFYCGKCKAFRTRLQVSSYKYDIGYQAYAIDYRCKVCGSLVKETFDILSSMIKDYAKEEE